MKNIRGQKGFTIFESLIALALLGTVMAIIFVSTTGISDRLQRQKNEIFVQDMSELLSSYYNSNSFIIDRNGSGINVPQDNISISNGALTNRPEIIEQLNIIKSKISSTTTSLNDGYNQPMLILISNILEKNYQGNLIPYRKIAVVSNIDGEINNGIPDFQTSMNIRTGEINISEDEMVSVSNTYTEQHRKFIESKENVDNVTNSYGQYYWSRYNSIGEGQRNVNYFASGGQYWDDSPIRKSCDFSPDNISGYNTPGTKISNINLNTVLNIGVNSYYDAWGNQLYVSNCGTISNVFIGNDITQISPRNPDSPDTERSSQPYNAIIGFTMGNGQSYIKTIISRF